MADNRVSLNLDADEQQITPRAENDNDLDDIDIKVKPGTGGGHGTGSASMRISAFSPDFKAELQRFGDADSGNITMEQIGEALTKVTHEEFLRAEAEKEKHDAQRRSDMFKKVAVVSICSAIAGYILLFGTVYLIVFGGLEQYKNTDTDDDGNLTTADGSSAIRVETRTYTRNDFEHLFASDFDFDNLDKITTGFGSFRVQAVIATMTPAPGNPGMLMPAMQETRIVLTTRDRGLVFTKNGVTGAVDSPYWATSIVLEGLLSHIPTAAAAPRALRRHRELQVVKHQRRLTEEAEEKKRRLMLEAPEASSEEKTRRLAVVESELSESLESAAKRMLPMSAGLSVDEWLYDMTIMMGLVHPTTRRAMKRDMVAAGVFLYTKGDFADDTQAMIVADWADRVQMNQALMRGMMILPMHLCISMLNGALYMGIQYGKNWPAAGALSMADFNNYKIDKDGLISAYRQDVLALNGQTGQVVDINGAAVDPIINDMKDMMDAIGNMIGPLCGDGMACMENLFPGMPGCPAPGPPCPNAGYNADQCAVMEACYMELKGAFMMSMPAWINDMLECRYSPSDRSVNRTDSGMVTCIMGVQAQQQNLASIATAAGAANFESLLRSPGFPDGIRDGLYELDQAQGPIIAMLRCIGRREDEYVNTDGTKNYDSFGFVAWECVQTHMSVPSSQ